MTARRNVLVFPCGSEIGLELHRALETSPHFTLFGASSVPDHGAFVYRRYIPNLPMLGEPDFPAALAAVVAQFRIDYLLPAHDEALVRMSAWAEAGVLGAEVAAPTASVCRLCRSKSMTYDFFAGKVPVPRRHRLSELTDDDFPVFIKPDTGQGSKGTLRADDRAAAAEKLRRSPKDIICEYLPGREYTVDCFTDRRGRLLYAAGRERRRIMNGISVNGLEVRDSRLGDMAKTINDEIAMRGAWFFQARESTGGELKLLEIAPRIAGTSGLARAKGVNLPLLTLYDRMNLDLHIIDNRIGRVEIDRALASRFRLSIEYDTVYMDLDDTLLFGESVNLDAVRFLYQCRNKGKRLALVTRHIFPPEETLRLYRLESLFDQVFWLKDNENKSSVMHGKAIFIDDSFIERLEVSRALGLPVFDPSSIEALLE